MRIFVLLLLILIYTVGINVCTYGNIEYSQNTPIDIMMNRDVIKIPIIDLFQDECLSDEGKELLHELSDKIGKKKVYIECSTNQKLDYTASWELANIYVYKVVKYLILCCKISPDKISYIGYGTMSKGDSEPNRIEFILTDE